MKRTVFLPGLAGVGLTLAGSWQRPDVRPGPRTARALDLIALFGPRGIVRDSNDDGIADSVAARVIVPAAPAVEDGVAAVNIAARLGFETSSLTLPMVLRDNAVPQPARSSCRFVVGRTNVRQGDDQPR